MSVAFIMCSAGIRHVHIVRQAAMYAVGEPVTEAHAPVASYGPQWPLTYISGSKLCLLPSARMSAIFIAAENAHAPYTRPRGEKRPFCF